jgi:ketosteroid isomerase-like protein
VEIVRRVTKAFAAGDMETVFELVAPEIEWNFSNAQTWVEEPVYRGYDGIMQFFSKWTGEWEDYRFEFEEVIDAGDKVVVVVRDEGKSKSAGIKLERRHAEVWTLRDSRVVRIEPFDNKHQALGALGLSEEDTHADSS